jgi:hypothetical protein
MISFSSPLSSYSQSNQCLGPLISRLQLILIVFPLGQKCPKDAQMLGGLLELKHLEQRLPKVQTEEKKFSAIDTDCLSYVHNNSKKLISKLGNLHKITCQSV